MKKYLDMFLDYLKNEKGSSENTIISYGRDIKYFIKFIEINNIDDFNDVMNEHISKYIEHLQSDGKASTTISRNIASVRSVFKFLLNKGIVQSDPTASVGLPKVEKTQIRALTAKEMGILLSKPSTNTPKGMRDKAMMELLYSTGIRVSQLISLKISNVNMQNSNIKFNDRGNVRTIIFTKNTYDALDKYLSEGRNSFVNDSTDDTLFLNFNGDTMTRQGLWKILRQYGEQAKSPQKITPHIFRHSLAIHMIEEGVDLEDVQAILGHSDISTTQVYMKLAKKNKS